MRTNFEFLISNFESMSNEITTSVQRGASVSDIINSGIENLLKIRNLKFEIVLPGGQK